MTEAGGRARFFTGPPDDPTRYHVSAADLAGGIAGGEGLVYRACRTGTDDVVALKVLSGTDLAGYERVAARSSLLIGLRHPHLMEQIETFLGCPLTERPIQAVEDFDVPYSVARWIDGEPLADAVDGASTDDRLTWIHDLAEALDHLHSPSSVAPAGIVHRDVKPSNVRIRSDGSAVLLDYGVARDVDPTDMTERVGTYLWRAPEVLGGGPAPAGTAADVWGLGALAHWLFVGEPPHLDGAAAARERLVRSDLIAVLPRGPALARHLSDLVHSDPADRPDDLGQWARRLAHLARRRRLGRPARRVLAALAGVTAVVVLGLVASELVREPPAESATAPTTTTAAEPSTTTAGTLPDTIPCSGWSNGRMWASPAITRQDDAITFDLRGGSTFLLCQDGQTTRTARFRVLSFEFPSLGCDRIGRTPFEPIEGDGVGMIAWGADADSSSVEVRVRLEGALQGSFRVTGLSGPLTGYTGMADFVIDGFASQCDPGIESVQVSLRELTIRRGA